MGNHPRIKLFFKRDPRKQVRDLLYRRAHNLDGLDSFFSEESSRDPQLFFTGSTHSAVELEPDNVSPLNMLLEEESSQDPLDIFMLGLDTDLPNPPRTASPDEASTSSPKSRKTLPLKMKRKAVTELPHFNHCGYAYPRLKKDVYTESKAVTSMTDQELEELRRRLNISVSAMETVSRPIRAWSEAGVSVDMLKRLEKMKFTDPRPLQQQAIPIILGGHDVVLISPPGAGDVLSFAIPLVMHLRNNPKRAGCTGPGALVLVPDGDSLRGVASTFKRITKFEKVVAVSKEVDPRSYIKELKSGSDIVVATPFKLERALIKRFTSLRATSFVVVHKAQQHLGKGAERCLQRLMDDVRPDGQVVVTSTEFEDAYSGWVVKGVIITVT